MGGGGRTEWRADLREIRRSVQRTYASIAGGALIVSAIIALTIPNDLAAVAGVPVLTWVLGLLGTAIIVYFWPRERD